MKRGGYKDWELTAFVLEGDWTFVTKNSFDFRGSADDPGRKGQYADIALHAGLICLNGPPGMDLGMQVELFDEVLEELARNGDLVNQVLEVTLEDDIIHVRRYELPTVNQ